MKHLLATLLFLGLSATAWAENATSPNTTDSKRWSVDRANRWYAAQPWSCGLNYIPANAVSYTEMWMPYCFDEKFIDQELALAEKIGFNCVRVVLPFVVWEHDPKAFKERFGKFLEICDRHHIKVMPVFFDDCAFGSDPKLRNPWYGKQPEVLKGWYASGWTPSPGHDMVRDPKTWPRLERYVKDLLSTYRDDKRVWVWDLYNEPGNGDLGTITQPLVEKVFGWAREIDPSQPLTIAVWNRRYKKLDEFLFANCDIITFHNYSNAKHLAKQIEDMKKEGKGRPIIATEWLNRIWGSKSKECLPVFAKENVGCMHWGLVNGKTQTHLGWGWRPGRPAPKVWQHDLFHSDHKPYDKEEIELFRETIRAKHK